MYYIGIDIGGMSIKGGLTNEKGEILFRHTVVTGSYTKEHTIASDLCVVVDELLKQSGISTAELCGIGVGSPGSIDSDAGIIRYSNNIPMEKVEISSPLSQKYGVPVSIANDADCAALGEQRFGGGMGKKDVILITLGTGVGSGFIIDGKLYSGRKSAGAEAGHMVIRTGGEKCNCGRRGCWERYASASGLIRQTTAVMGKYPDSLMHKIADVEGKVSGKTAFDAAKQGDKAGAKVVKQYLKYVSEGIINLANIFRPQFILIGGGISHEGDYILKPLQRSLNSLTYGAKFNPKVKLALATLGNDAGLLGAAALNM